MIILIVVLVQCTPKYNCYNIPVIWNSDAKAIKKLRKVNWSEKFEKRYEHYHDGIYRVIYNSCDNGRSILIIEHVDNPIKYYNDMEFYANESYSYLSYFQDVPQSLFDKLLLSNDKTHFISEFILPEYRLSIDTRSWWVKYPLLRYFIIGVIVFNLLNFLLEYFRKSKRNTDN